MSRIAWAAAASLVAAGATVAASSWLWALHEEERWPTDAPAPRRSVEALWSHRCNRSPCLDAALAAGAGGVEIDVRCREDHVLVAAHDPQPGDRAPTVAALLQRHGPRLSYWLDLKELDDRFVDDCGDGLAALSSGRAVWIEGEDLTLLLALRTRAPRVALVARAPALRRSRLLPAYALWLRALRAARIEAVSWPAHAMDSAVAARLRGVRLFVFGAGDEQAATKLLHQGAAVALVDRGG